MSESVAQVGELEIAYDSFGDPGDPAMLLIMGLGMQMTGWDPQLCELLAAEGFHVIRFDNRDVGHSTKIRDERRVRLSGVLLGNKRTAAYGLEDMADDAVGLLDALEIDAAHVVGASLGGMIAQLVAIRSPKRVLSLASLMSGPGDRWNRLPRLRVLGTFLRRAPKDRDGYVDHAVKMFRLIGSPDYPTDEDRLRERSGVSFDRSHYPLGVSRQLQAATSSSSRKRYLRELRLPTVVIHGAEDRLAPARGGRATAKAIPGAELVEIPGMGHDLPRQLWPRIVEAIVRNARRAQTGTLTTAESQR